MNHCWLLSEDIIWRSAMFNHDAISINAWSHNFSSPLSQFRTCKHDNLSTKVVGPTDLHLVFMASVKMTSFKFFRPYLYEH